jgi:hypothetical protein
MNRDEAITLLREWIKPGDTVYTVLRHVSRSGMQRVIGVVVLMGDGSTWHPTHAVSVALGYTEDRNRDGVKVSGCGMDMGFELVYNLGRVLYPDGFSTVGKGPVGHNIAPGMSSREQVANAIAAGYTFRGRNGDTLGWDNNGGYALTHRWI